MGQIFIDTSALYALVATEDKYHRRAVLLWQSLADGDDSPITTNYILTECFAIVQNRLGLEFVRYLHEEVVPALEVLWLDKEHHDSALEQVLSANRRNLSLVDCSSFDTMRRLGIETAFTFDPHFREQGFSVIPQ